MTTALVTRQEIYALFQEDEHHLCLLIPGLINLTDGLNVNSRHLLVEGTDDFKLAFAIVSIIDELNDYERPAFISCLKKVIKVKNEKYKNTAWRAAKDMDPLPKGLEKMGESVSAGRKLLKYIRTRK